MTSAIEAPAVNAAALLFNWPRFKKRPQVFLAVLNQGIFVHLIAGKFLRSVVAWSVSLKAMTMGRLYLRHISTAYRRERNIMFY
jgi:hypothetical protein